MANIKTKILAATILLVVFALSVSAQKITGQWQGALLLPTGKLRVVFNISEKNQKYTATMDSPDQGVKGIPVTKITVEKPVITIEVASARIEYKGTLEGNLIKGTFTQAGQAFPMDLTQNTGMIKTNRPQEPKPPYPYTSEEIAFRNEKAGITLAGTLTLPKTGSNFPVVVLISGSGPQNRNEELFEHKPFLVIADYLTKNGIAVLRYDDRGVAESTGNFATATTNDFAGDVSAAVEYLKKRKEVNPKKIGLIGHSEGGIIAPMVAAASKDIHFIVLLAGVGIKADQLMLLQKKLIEERYGYEQAKIQESQQVFAGAYKIITNQSVDAKLLKDKVYNYFKTASKDKFPEEQLQGLAQQLTSPWFIYFLRFDPAVYLSKVTCPVLALNGEKDLQVPPKQNLPAIKSALKNGGNNNVTIVELENLNHLFQECSTGLPNEYGTIEQTFSPKALATMKDWILQLSGK